MPALTGFRDFYPPDCARRQRIFAVWREVAARYGFVEYDGPPLEELELITRKSGAEIAGELYHFEDKGGRAVTLRPEMTPTLARMVAAGHRDYKKPLKWFSIPQVFRYERPQKGRLREHFQFNCDIIGETSLEADIELIALLIDTLRAFGLTDKDFIVRVSDRVFWTEFLQRNGVSEAEWYAAFQAIDKVERQPREKTEAALGALAQPVFKILEEGGASERLDAVEAGLAARGLAPYVRRDLRIIRGLAYYTGIVFEAFDRSGQFRAIGAGGRYDDLLKNLGETDLPALGFGMGDVVLGLLLEEKGLLRPEASPARLDAYVVVPDESFRARAGSLVQRLRDAGLRVDIALAPGRIGKQFQAAEERGARFAVVADAELDCGAVIVKELATREQRTVPEAELIPALTPSKSAVPPIPAAQTSS
jgi:histidyl-tRNA synthetase